MTSRWLLVATLTLAACGGSGADASGAAGSVLAGVVGSAADPGASGPDAESAARTSTTSDPTGAAETDPSTSTTAGQATASPDDTAAPTTPARPGCPDAASGPPDRSFNADVDGDGAVDVVGVRFASETVVVSFAAGGSAEVPIPTGRAGIPGIDALGGADVDGDGSDEAWVMIGSGASSQLVSLFTFDDCGGRVVTEGGDPAVFGVGGSVTNLGGVQCSGSELIVRMASSDTGDVYDVEVTAYRLVGSELTPVDRRTEQVARSDPDFGRSSTLSCGNATL